MTDGGAMKYILVSDSHGDITCLEYLKNTHKDAEAFFHCGDLQLPAEMTQDFISVRGNTDFDPDYPWMRVVGLGEIRALMCHGHQLLSPFDRSDFTMLANAAAKYECSAVFFGHTHVSVDETVNGIRVLNPGSIRRPKDPFFPYPTYMILHVDKDTLRAERIVYNPQF